MMSIGRGCGGRKGDQQTRHLSSKAADPVCPSDNYTDYIVKSEAKVSASLLTRVLSSLGLAGQYEKDAKVRLPTQDDKIMAILTFGTICRMVMQDATLTTWKEPRFYRNG
jgi:hypothetical protein